MPLVFAPMNSHYYTVPAVHPYSYHPLDAYYRPAVAESPDYTAALLHAIARRQAIEARARAAQVARERAEARLLEQERIRVLMRERERRARAERAQAEYERQMRAIQLQRAAYMKALTEAAMTQTAAPKSSPVEPAPKPTPSGPSDEHPLLFLIRLWASQAAEAASKSDSVKPTTPSDAASSAENPASAVPTAPASPLKRTPAQKHVRVESTPSVEQPSFRVPISTPEDKPSTRPSTPIPEAPKDAPSAPAPIEDARASTPAALSTLSTLSSQFHALDSAFTFPAHIDLPHPSSPEPSLVSSASTSSSPLAIPHTRANAPLHRHAFQLERILAQLDAIETNGDDEVRRRRKELAQAVERALARIERGVEAAMADEEATASSEVAVGADATVLPEAAQAVASVAENVVADPTPTPTENPVESEAEAAASGAPEQDVVHADSTPDVTIPAEPTTLSSDLPTPSEPKAVPVSEAITTVNTDTPAHSERVPAAAGESDAVPASEPVGLAPAITDEDPLAALPTAIAAPDADLAEVRRSPSAGISAPSSTPASPERIDDESTPDLAPLPEPALSQTDTAVAASEEDTPLMTDAGAFVSPALPSLPSTPRPVSPPPLAAEDDDDLEALLVEAEVRSDVSEEVAEEWMEV